MFRSTFFFLTIVATLLTSTAAFVVPSSSSPSSSSMTRFAAKAGESADGSQKRAYVPAGLTREEYEAILAKDEEKKNKKLSYKGGTGETLEEFQARETEGFRVKHRFPKFKFPGWFEDE